MCTYIPKCLFSLQNYISKCWNFFLPVRYLRWESDQHRWGPLCLPAVCHRVSDLSPATESFLILWATRLVTWKLHTGRQVLELNQNITFATCYKFTNRTGVLVLFIILFYYGNSNQKMVFMSGSLIKVHCIKAYHGNQFLLDNFSFHQVKRKRKELYSRILSIIVFR